MREGNNVLYRQKNSGVKKSQKHHNISTLQKEQEDPNRAFFIGNFDKRQKREYIYSELRKVNWQGQTLYVKKLDLPKADHKEARAGENNRGYAFVHTKNDPAMIKAIIEMGHIKIGNTKAEVKPYEDKQNPKTALLSNQGGNSASWATMVKSDDLNRSFFIDSALGSEHTNGSDSRAISPSLDSSKSSMVSSGVGGVAPASLNASQSTLPSAIQITRNLSCSSTSDATPTPENPQSLSFSTTSPFANTALYPLFAQQQIPLDQAYHQQMISNAALVEELNKQNVDPVVWNDYVRMMQVQYQTAYAQACDEQSRIQFLNSIQQTIQHPSISQHYWNIHQQHLAMRQVALNHVSANVASGQTELTGNVPVAYHTHHAHAIPAANFITPVPTTAWPTATSFQQ